MVHVFGGIPERIISNPINIKPRYRILISGVFSVLVTRERRLEGVKSFGGLYSFSIISHIKTRKWNQCAQQEDKYIVS